jgi:hypothetical protein
MGWWGKSALLVAIFSLLFNCNRLPSSYIFKKFDDNGNVTYNVSSYDSDGSIIRVDSKLNNGLVVSHTSNFSLTTPVIDGQNIFETTAYDNAGAAEQIPQKVTFTPFTKEEANKLISDTLNSKRETYNSLEKSVLISFGAGSNFYADFLVKRLNSTDAIINYSGFQSDVAVGLANKELLEMYGVPILQLNMLPSEEINLRLNSFIEKGYNDN